MSQDISTEILDGLLECDFANPEWPTIRLALLELKRRRSEDWQGMETSPKDVLLLFKDEAGFLELGFWDGMIYRNQMQGSLRIRPLMWMKIPGGSYDLFPQVVDFAAPKES